MVYLYLPEVCDNPSSQSSVEGGNDDNSYLSYYNFNNNSSIKLLYNNEIIQTILTENDDYCLFPNVYKYTSIS